MSLHDIAALLADADQTDVDASLLEGTPAEELKARARVLRQRANDLADRTKPGVMHPNHGYGVCVGVTKAGQLEVAFGGDPFAIALSVDKVRAAE